MFVREVVHMLVIGNIFDQYYFTFYFSINKKKLISNHKNRIKKHTKNMCFSVISLVIILVTSKGRDYFGHLLEGLNL
jgi:hypothetical protein